MPSRPSKDFTARLPVTCARAVGEGGITRVCPTESAVQVTHGFAEEIAKNGTLTSEAMSEPLLPEATVQAVTVPVAVGREDGWSDDLSRLVIEVEAKAGDEVRVAECPEGRYREHDFEGMNNSAPSSKMSQKRIRPAFAAFKASIVILNLVAILSTVSS
jgi:hypothetical protein